MQSVLQQERQWAGLESKTIKVGDTSFAYSEGGAKDAPTVLLIHGFRAHVTTGIELLTNSPKIYVVALDLPAHGDTVVPANFGYQLADLSDAVRQFVLALGIQKRFTYRRTSPWWWYNSTVLCLVFLEVKALLVDTAGVYDNVGKSLIAKPEDLRNMLDCEKRAILSVWPQNCHVSTAIYS